MALQDPHKRHLAYEQRWFDANGHNDCLDPAHRKKLQEFLDLSLEQERNETLPGNLPEADISEVKRPKDDEPDFTDPVHDPKLYLFGAKKVWIPWALDGRSGAKRGRYRNGYPSGLVVHWTAGHRNGATAGVNLMRATGMLYMLIDHEGACTQTDPLTHWGYHAGSSSHSGASGSVSDEYAGVEIQAAGHLRKSGNFFYPWWDKGKNLPSNRIPKSEVVYSNKRENIAAGHYHAYTQEQMTRLRILVCWLHLNNPSVFSISRVVGHDEVSPGRKVDPGGALVGLDGEVITMSEFRDWIRLDIEAIRENAGK